MLADWLGEFDAQDHPNPEAFAAEVLEPCLSLTNRKRLSRLEQEYPA